MGSNSKIIVWFRRDLRVEDNPALSAAARDGSVFPVYIWCPKEEGQFYPGRVSRWWLKQSLAHLEHSLRSLGAPLVLIKTQSTLAALLDCIQAIGATKLVYNHLYDPVSLVRDHEIKKTLVELGISVQSYNGDLLYEPWEVYDEKGHAFTTFDAYWDKCLHMQVEPVLHLPPWQLVPAAGTVENCSIEELVLENETEKSSNALLGRGWSPGWSNADKALSEFVERHLLDYSKDRLKVSGNSASLLSPYLHFGELSVSKVFHCVRMKQILWKREENTVGEESAALFLKAIGLREYSRYICFNFPFTHERSLLSSLKYFPWHADQTLFKAWRQGRSGYPLVDAGMRELWATGWIHNKIRVIVSSFFVKFLLLPWQWGMKYFWDTLLDADLESDILGWQYISGSLPDGHELERLDSPQVLGFNFDPEGEYVRHWLPELARMPTEWIHHPWDAPLTVLKAAGVELGVNYPKPIVDIDLARDRLTEAILIMRENEVAAQAKNSNGMNEEVVDNSDSVEISGIPKVIIKEKTFCPTSSCNDQKVPTMQNLKNESINRKRPKYIEDERPLQNKLPNCKDISRTSRMDDDVCSTAESSSAKKQTTSSIISFSVPQSHSSSSKGKPLQDFESSDLKQPCHELIDREQSANKNELHGG
ncbi:cryptochrome-1 isoform X2 [Actinidia eriantha]|uniref:cryptochrome-1 isoform X2 n=1 Tax=Actinidia eriantha TaxID=165200 RepID=UPI00258C0800|nr:cryptochrome-1 isoform X2 [Actinidia eriantha]